MNRNLSDLLADKDFDQLTKAEQAFVLSKYSKENYCDQRKAIVSARILLKDEVLKMQPNQSIAINSLAALREKNKRGIGVIFMHKTPTWVAVAACALLFLFLNYSPFQETVSPNENTQYITQIDTVFVEKVITKFQNVKSENTSTIPNKTRPIKTEHSTVKSQDLNNHPSPSFTDEMLGAEQVNYSDLLQNFSTPKGVSIHNDSITQAFNRTVF